MCDADEDLLRLGKKVKNKLHALMRVADWNPFNFVWNQEVVDQLRMSHHVMYHIYMSLIHVIDSFTI